MQDLKGMNLAVGLSPVEPAILGLRDHFATPVA
jgi:hypothetical protein